MRLLRSPIPLTPLRLAVLAAALPLLAATARADDPPPLTVTAGAPASPTLADVLKVSPRTDWRPLDPDNTIYMELAAGRVVMELAPTFAPNHAVNIKKLVRERYFDGLSIMRSQENYVVQWGNPDEKNPRPLKTAQRNLQPEFTVALASDKTFVRMPDVDGYAPQIGYSNGFPVAHNPATGRAWMAHCYGMVGVGRDNGVDTGDGTELYVVTGQAPRQLDRNITLVARVISGMSLLTTLPRGTAAMGFYDKPEQFVAIKSMRIAGDLPDAERSKLEIVKTDSATFTAALAALRNRGGDWYKVPAGHLDLCNVPVMVRAAP